MNYWNTPCSFVPTMPVPTQVPALDRSSPVVRWVSTIASIVNYPASIPVFIQPGSNNAFAVLGHPNFVGDEAIIYDPILISSLAQRYSDAAPIAVLAHEIGHLLHGQQVPGFIADWGDEMRADHFAGYALGRLNIPRKPIQAWLVNETIADFRHPDGYTRAWTIENGYIAGGGNPWV